MPNDCVTVARRWFEEVWNQRRAETIDELLTAESVCYADDGPITGPHEFRERMYAPLLAAFPDVRVTIEGTLVEGTNVVVRWTATGTHTGNGLGFPPSGKPIVLRGITWLHIPGGKLMEGWQYSNMRDVIRGLAE